MNTIRSFLGQSYATSILLMPPVDFFGELNGALCIGVEMRILFHDEN